MALNDILRRNEIHAFLINEIHQMNVLK